MRTALPACLGLLASLGALGCAGVPLQKNVRDEGAIPMPGNDPVIHFIVSLNKDDDDADTQEDRLQGPPTAREDNLRALKFNHAGAVQAALAHPQYNDATGRSAVGSLIRAWKSDRVTPFPFNAPQPVPLVVYFEGIGTETTIDQFLFEYGYIDAQGKLVGQGLAYGTVVEVDTEASMSTRSDTRLLEASPKILITATVEAEVAVSPVAPTVAWSHPRATTAPADALTTQVTAGDVPTPTRDADLLKVEITAPGQQGKIVAEGPLNIVAPDQVRIDSWDFPNGWTGGVGGRSVATANANRDVTWIGPVYRIPQNVQDARQDIIDLFTGRVHYRIDDQFGDPIAEAPKDRAKIVIREDVPLRSAMPAGTVLVSDLQAKLDQIVSSGTTPDWREAPDTGIFPDRLTLSLSPSHFMTQAGGALRLVRGTAGDDLVTMATHDWHVGVRRRGQVHRDTTVTRNTLVVEVEAVTANPATMRYRSEYRVR